MVDDGYSWGEGKDSSQLCEADRKTIIRAPIENFRLPTEGQPGGTLISIYQRN
jgi:hypothetical protein